MNAGSESIFEQIAARAAAMGPELAARVRAHGGHSCYFKNLSACAAPIHDSRFDFPDRALVAGVTAFAGLTAAEMGKKEERRSKK